MERCRNKRVETKTWVKVMVIKKDLRDGLEKSVNRDTAHQNIKI